MRRFLVLDVHPEVVKRRLLQFAQSNAALTIALLIIMGVVLLLFACAERIERRLLRWRGAIFEARSSS